MEDNKEPTIEDLLKLTNFYTLSPKKQKQILFKLGLMNWVEKNL